jgi:hypothetical protein
LREVGGPIPVGAVKAMRAFALRILILQLVFSPLVAILVLGFGAPGIVGVLYVMGILWTGGVALVMRKGTMNSNHATRADI